MRTGLLGPKRGDGGCNGVEGVYVRTCGEDCCPGKEEGTRTDIGDTVLMCKSGFTRVE